MRPFCPLRIANFIPTSLEFSFGNHKKSFNYVCSVELAICWPKLLLFTTFLFLFITQEEYLVSISPFAGFVKAGFANVIKLKKCIMEAFISHMNLSFHKQGLKTILQTLDKEMPRTEYTVGTHVILRP